MRNLLSILLIFVVTSFVYAQDYTPEFESSDCPYFMQVVADENDTSIWCGTLFVPENRADANSPDVELFVAYVESRMDTNNAPIVYLEGGPGGAASIVVTDWITFGITQTYDAIFIDQRGTGLSYPSLNCWEFDQSEDDEWLGECRGRLVDEGVDLNMYNSANNANDIHDLLVALDIPQANIYGSSYGVRLALTVMRDFPERIRAVIIDAVYPPQVSGLVEQATYGNRAFEQVFTDCAENAACNTAYPNLRESFYTAIETMNETPAEIYDEESDFVFEMNGDDFANDIFGQLYDGAAVPYLPALIAAYADGDYEYDPQLDEVERILDEQFETGSFEADEYDLLVMEQFDFDNVEEVYDYYTSLTDEEFDALMLDLEDRMYYAPFQSYLELGSLDEAIDYVDSLDEEEFYELEVWVHGIYDDDSEGMYYSVECAEEIPFYTEDDVIAYSEPLPDIIEDALNKSALYGFEECEIWDVTTADEIEVQPVVSEIPTLIYSGVYDPITPPEWGDDAAQYLANSWHYVFSNAGHGALESGDCVFSITLEFLMTPLQEPDSTCLGEVLPPNFFIR